MAKFPYSPGVEALAHLEPAWIELSAGTRLARIYYTHGPRPQSWNEFRHHGPLNSRWVHHQPDANGRPHDQERGVYYAARDAKTCLAEFFQQTRRIDRAFQAPWLVIFEIEQPLRLIDLTGDFPTRMGASMAIHTGSRSRARGWARDLHQAFPDGEGILYASSMNANESAIALNERAEARHPFPAHPVFHRALADDVLLDPLKYAARHLGYALR